MLRHIYPPLPRFLARYALARAIERLYEEPRTRTTPILTPS